MDFRNGDRHESASFYGVIDDLHPRLLFVWIFHFIRRGDSEHANVGGWIHYG